MIRKIVLIDEEKCDGCGLCADACAEGAIRVIDGKARLVSESYCDGLGACIGECPRGAISIVEREAEAFDEEAAARHIAAASEAAGGRPQGPGAGTGSLPCGCPGSMAREIGEETGAEGAHVTRLPAVSRLRNWPVQLRLVPADAPYLRGADLLLAADCAGFASPDLHPAFLEGKVLLVGCPKLDDAALHRDKLASMLRDNDIRSLTVLFMEVPCCSGLVNIAIQAVTDSGKEIPLRAVKLGIRGRVLEELEPVGA